jgi:predicted metal-dependent hydrolase
MGLIFKLFVFSAETQHLGVVSKIKKTERMALMAAQFAAEGVDARYAGYFVLFNEQKFYEAHDILEDLWLPDRKGKNGNFYKGLIQLAGAFVHLQKNRLRPSAALFKLAQANLNQFPAFHEQLDLAGVQVLIQNWLKLLEGSDFMVNPLKPGHQPRLGLVVVSG